MKYDSYLSFKSKKRYTRLYTWDAPWHKIASSKGRVTWEEFLQREADRINAKPGRHAVIVTHGGPISLYVNDMSVTQHDNSAHLRACFPAQFKKAYPETDLTATAVCAT